jgi:hypothetical protein
LPCRLVAEVQSQRNRPIEPKSNLPTVIPVTPNYGTYDITPSEKLACRIPWYHSTCIALMESATADPGILSIVERCGRGAQTDSGPLGRCFNGRNLPGAVSIYSSHPVPLATTSQCMLGRRGRSPFLHVALQLAPGCASRASVSSVPSFQLDFSHTRSLDHGPHPSRA